MRRATSSSSAAPPSLSHRKRIAREQLLKSLEILGPLSAPLPPELPPSPPPSPATSPRSKRKLEADLDQGRSKKPRTSLETSSVRPSLSQPRPRSIKSEPEEDGELKEEPVAIPDPVAAPTSSLPVRRPRRGIPHLDDKDLNEAHDKFFSNARLLKYSGGERLLSTFPATASNYKPLADPSPVGSSYYKNGEVIARLETIDALVHFAYSIWTKDYNLKTCYRRTWDTMKDMIALNKPYWEHGGEREKVFFGLITMIQGYISARRIRYMVKGAHAETQRLMTRFNIYASASMKRAAAEAAKAQSQTEAQAQPQSQAPPTPQTLSSPAGASTSSSSSTPLTSNTTPSTSATSVDSAPSAPPNHPPLESVNMPVRSGYLYCQHQQAKGLLEASDCMDIAQRYLTISAMAKHFPRTFARMVNSTLTVQDEHEPAFDDDEGELFWPGQCITGEGLGWVALMGESMIREYGKEFGYKGMECIITKPPDAVSSSGGVPTPVIIPKMELEVLKR